MIDIGEWLRENAGRGWHHHKRDSDYVELGRGELQFSGPDELVDGAACVVYLSKDGKLYIREEAEFEDGRFAETDRHPVPGPMKLPDDLFSHREDFRSAISAMIDTQCENPEEQEANDSYWRHQLEVFDRISDYLDTVDVERIELGPKVDLTKKEAAAELADGDTIEVVTELPDFFRKCYKRSIPVHAVGDDTLTVVEEPTAGPVRVHTNVIEIPEAAQMWLRTHDAARGLKEMGDHGAIDLMAEHSLPIHYYCCGFGATRSFGEERPMMVGLVLFNDCGATMTVGGQTVPLLPGSVYVYDRRHTHSAYARGDHTKCFAVIEGAFAEDDPYVTDPEVFAAVMVYSTLHPLIGAPMSQPRGQGMVEWAKGYLNRDNTKYFHTTVIAGLVQLIERQNKALEDKGFTECFREGYDAATMYWSKHMEMKAAQR